MDLFQKIKWMEHCRDHSAVKLLFLTNQGRGRMRAVKVKM